jgi:integrase
MGKQAKLTALQVEKSKPGTIGDGGGLYLQTTSATARSWLIRYKRGGKERWYGLGSFPAVSLQAAREKAADVRKMLAANIDPLEQKRKQQAAATAAAAEAAAVAAKTKTFDECCREYLEAHENEWTPKHRDEWISTLKRYASPVLGAVPVDAITTAKILEVLKPHWARRAATMMRLRNRMELVLDCAKVKEYRSGENPARWRGNLEPQLAKPSKIRKVKHHPSVPYSAIPIVMQRLSGRASISAAALRFLVLCAGRAGEVRLAKWQEFDFEKGKWCIPAARMKNREECERPITKTMRTILSALPRDSEYVFHIGGEPLTHRALMKVLTLNYTTSHVVPHGLRASFRNWCSEKTNVASAVAEACLAHKRGDATQAAYDRSDLYEKRRKLMARWDAYCTGQKVRKQRRRRPEPTNTANIIPYTQDKRRAYQ